MLSFYTYIYLVIWIFLIISEFCVCVLFIESRTCKHGWTYSILDKKPSCTIPTSMKVNMVFYQILFLNLNLKSIFCFFVIALYSLQEYFYMHLERHDETVLWMLVVYLTFPVKLAPHCFNKCQKSEGANPRLHLKNILTALAVSFGIIGLPKDSTIANQFLPNGIAWWN